MSEFPKKPNISTKFIWDPKTRRFYKDAPRSSGIRFLENYRSQAGIELPSSAKSLISSKKQNLTSSIFKRQSGCSSYLSFQTEVLTLRAKNMHLMREFRVPSFISPEDARVALNFLKGGVNSIYGIWKVSPYESDPYLLISEIRHAFTPSTYNLLRMVHVEPDLQIADICEGIDDTQKLLYVANPLYSFRPGCIGLINHYEMSTTIPISHTVRCCTNNVFSQKYFVGVDKGLVVLAADDGFTSYRPSQIRESVHAVQCNSSGDVLYYGTQDGTFAAMDLRTKMSIFRMKLSKICLNDLLIIDDTDIICSGIDGFLVNIDLRMNAIATTYHKHVGCEYKFPVSISKSHNLLCARGNDNITRLWPLYGGEPISKIPPPDIHSNCRPWLVSDSSECALYMAQENRLSCYGHAHRG